MKIILIKNKLLIAFWKLSASRHNKNESLSIVGQVSISHWILFNSEISFTINLNFLDFGWSGTAHSSVTILWVFLVSESMGGFRDYRLQPCSTVLRCFELYMKVCDTDSVCVSARLCAFCMKVVVWCTILRATTSRSSATSFKIKKTSCCFVCQKGPQLKPPPCLKPSDRKPEVDSIAWNVFGAPWNSFANCLL